MGDLDLDFASGNSNSKSNFVSFSNNFNQRFDNWEDSALGDVDLDAIANEQKRREREEKHRQRQAEHEQRLFEKRRQILIEK